MEIVIDISEKDFIEIFINGLENNEIINLIRKGTPLPKGHGKLVDIEDVKDNIRKWRGYLDEDMMTRINFAMDNHIPTIIEADKAESEDKE